MCGRSSSWGRRGAGKSRLVEEFTGGLDPNVTVLSARAAPLGNSDPMGLWGAGPWTATSGGLTDEEVIRLCGGVVDDLGALSRRAAAVAGRLSEAPRLPPVRGVSPRCWPGWPGPGDRWWWALDDVHLADASSWEGPPLRGPRGWPTARSWFLATAPVGGVGQQRQEAGSVAFALEQEGRPAAGCRSGRSTTTRCAGLIGRRDRCRARRASLGGLGWRSVPGATFCSPHGP